MSSRAIEKQLERLERGFLASLERATAIFVRVPENLLWETAMPARWSVGECLEHLNLTHRAMLERMDREIRRASPRAPRRPYRLGWMGWFIVQALEPGRMPAKTAPSFVPRCGGPVPELRAEFGRLVQLLIAVTRRGTAVDFGQLRMESPFRAGLHYSLYDGLRITEVHLRRHLRQAEEAAAALGAT